MKRTLVAAATAAALALGACAHPVTINGKEYEPYGVANEGSKKDPNVKYELSFGSVAVGVVLFETVLFPVYVVGWDLWQPVELKDPDAKPAT